jgi:hypothetical protein
MDPSPITASFIDKKENILSGVQLGFCTCFPIIEKPNAFGDLITMKSNLANSRIKGINELSY